MKYLDEFLNAIKRTEKLKLKHNTSVIDITDKYIQPETYYELQKVILEHFPKFEKGAYQARCHEISIKAKPILEDYFDSDIFLTLGDISIQGKRQFGFDEQYLRKLLESKQSQEKLKLHAWLTLPSMEIIDLSFGHSLPLILGLPKMNEFILHSPDNLNGGLEYHPILIGETFLKEKGSLRYTEQA